MDQLKSKIIIKFMPMHILALEQIFYPIGLLFEWKHIAYDKSSAIEAKYMWFLFIR